MLTVGNRVMWDAELQGTIILYEQDGDREYIRVKLDNDHTVTTMRQSMWGIPLTPELLERCGFEKCPSDFGGWVYPIAPDEKIRLVNDGTIGWNWPLYGNTPVKCQYLHELQNLIHALTGKPLEIK